MNDIQCESLARDLKELARSIGIDLGQLHDKQSLDDDEGDEMNGNENTTIGLRTPDKFVAEVNHMKMYDVLFAATGQVVCRVPFVDEYARRTARHIADILNTAGYRWEGVSLEAPPSQPPAVEMPAKATTEAGRFFFHRENAHVPAMRDVVAKMSTGERFVGTAVDESTADVVVNALNQYGTAAHGAPITRDGVTIARCAPDHAERLQAASDSYDSLSAEVLDLNAELSESNGRVALFADECLHAMRIAHSRIVRALCAAIPEYGENPEVEEIQRELTALEAAMAMAGNVRDEADQ